MTAVDRVAAATTASPAMPALTSTSRLLPANLLRAVLARVLSWFGFDPNANPGQPFGLAVLAWVRREIEHTFFNQAPTTNYDQSANGLTVDGELIGDLNGADTEGNRVRYELVDDAELGTVELLDDGRFKYTGDLAEGQTDQFTVRVFDEAVHLFTRRSTFTTVTVGSVDDHDITHSTVDGKTVATGSLNYAKSADADLKYYVARPGAYGELTVDEAGNYLYTQTTDAAEFGLETFDHVNISIVDAGKVNGVVTIHTVRVDVALSDENGLLAVDEPISVTAVAEPPASASLIDTAALTGSDLSTSSSNSDYYTYTYDNFSSQTVMFAGFAVGGDKTDLAADPGNVEDYPVVGAMYQPGESATIKVEEGYEVYPVFVGLPNDDNTNNETISVYVFKANPGGGANSVSGCQSASGLHGCGVVEESTTVIETSSGDYDDYTESWMSDAIGASVIYDSDDAAKQADILNTVCSASGATCTFTVTASSPSYTDYGSDPVFTYYNTSGTAANSTVSKETVTNSTTYSVALSSTQQDTVLDTIDTAILEAFGYTVSDDWSKTYDLQITDVPADSTGSLYAAYPIYVIEGDWDVTLQYAEWELQDTTYKVVSAESDGTSLGDAEWDVSCADDGCGYVAKEVDSDETTSAASLIAVTTSQSDVDLASTTGYTAAGAIQASTDLDDVRGLALSADGLTLWATSYSGEEAVRVSSALGEDDLTEIALYEPALGILLNSDATFVYVTEPTADAVWVYDIHTDSQSSVTTDGIPTRLALDESEEWLYVVDQGATAVDLIDLSDGNALSRAADATYIPIDIAYGYDSTTGVAYLYVVDIEGYLTPYESPTSTVPSGVANPVVEVGSYPSAVAATADGQTVVVANAGDSTATIYDAASGETSTVAVGSAPSDVVISSDGEYAFVANFHDDTITVIRIDSAEVAGTIDAGSGPASLAVVDGSAGVYFVYVGNALDDTIDVIEITISSS
ncbi:YncE family protein [Mycobacterium sp. CVI_P3]|uniref:YncE family protein n=1 Tax=Mycobacterium pinniadriaticum TaxID=2994102 RepID=A0ABT3SK84_9MYCO|nr:YncE family protein [Mycobacterium pinniadriaticum]MCX2933151.1 YncE family protein [Mycobacterium pinniadriaticum]MCX2939549.1 YncE family protein [Mycobacterium pinniadriaticum]